jgi:hypothetical protein
MEKRLTMDVSLFFVRRRCWGANRNRESIGESGFFMEDEKLNKEGIIGKNGVHKRNENQKKGS